MLDARALGKLLGERPWGNVVPNSESEKIYTGDSLGVLTPIGKIVKIVD